MTSFQADDRYGKETTQEQFDRDPWVAIRNHRFYVYGTGAVAKRFYQLLSQRGCEGQVLGFVVTKKPSGADPLFFGKRVMCVNDIPQDALVLLAVHPVWQGDIEAHLEQAGIRQYAMMYWKLIDLSFGLPMASHQKIATREIVERMARCFYPYLAAYYLVMERYVKAREVSDSFYLRYWSVEGSPSAASARLRQFHALMDEYQRDGVTSLLKYPLKLTERRLILDGLHRTMIAHYFHEPYLYADIYQTHDALGDGSSVDFGGHAIKEVFTEDQLAELEQYREEILGRPSRT